MLFRSTNDSLPTSSSLESGDPVHRCRSVKRSARSARQLLEGVIAMVGMVGHGRTPIRPSMNERARLRSLRTVPSGMSRIRATSAADQSPPQPGQESCFGRPSTPPAATQVHQHVMAPTAGSFEATNLVPVDDRSEHRVLHEILTVVPRQRRGD